MYSSILISVTVPVIASRTPMPFYSRLVADLPFGCLHLPVPVVCVIASSSSLLHEHACESEKQKKRKIKKTNNSTVQKKNCDLTQKHNNSRIQITAQQFNETFGIIRNTCFPAHLYKVGTRTVRKKMVSKSSSGFGKH